MSRRLDFSPDEFNRFIAERWTNETCERCGHNDWIAGQTAREMYSTLGVYQPAFKLTPYEKNFHLLTVACNNCGNVRLTLADIFFEWLDDVRKDAP